MILSDLTTRFPRGLVLLALCGCLSGCANWDWSKLRGPGLSDNANWSHNLRGAPSAGRPGGLSQTAQDIERNLGYY